MSLASPPQIGCQLVTFVRRAIRPSDRLAAQLQRSRHRRVASSRSAGRSPPHARRRRPRPQAAERSRAGGSRAARAPAPAAFCPARCIASSPNPAPRIERSMSASGSGLRRHISRRPRRYSLAPPLAHGLGEIALEIAEERERRFRAPFLAHEQHRDRRREQRDRQRGFDRARRYAWLSSRSPSARLPIWSWFCRKLTKAVGASSPLGSPRDWPSRCAEASP